MARSSPGSQSVMCFEGGKCTEVSSEQRPDPEGLELIGSGR